MPAPGKIVASDTTIALPIAVPRCGCRRSIAWNTSSRLSVGGCTSEATPAKVTTPIRVLRGCVCTNARAASCAAASRVGLTSVARMLPDTSIARITVSCCAGSVTVAAGRPTDTSSSAIASRKRAGGRWRSRPRPGPADSTSPPSSRRAAARRRTQAA